MEAFTLGGIEPQFGNDVEGTVKSEEEVKTLTPTELRTDEEVAKDKQLEDKRFELNNPEIIAPERGATISAGEAKSKLEAEDVIKRTKLARFEANQNLEMTPDVLLRAGTAGMKKGFTVEQSEQKMREAGYQVPKGAIRDSVLQESTKIGKTKEATEKFGIPVDDSNAWTRFGDELQLIGTEAIAGVTSLTNETDLTADLQDNAKILREKEVAWKNANSSLNDDGSLNRPWNMAGGVAEIGAYGLIGAATGGITTLPNAAMKTAALADFVVASSLDTARALGDTEQTSTEYGVNIAANLLGFGAARYLPNAFGKKDPKMTLTFNETKAFTNATTEQKAFAVEYNNWLEVNKVKLAESDVSDFDTTVNMFVTEAQKNFTTASVVAKELETNLENLTKATFKMMGNMANTKEITPSMSNNIKQSLLNVETDLDNKISQAYKELSDLDPKTARVPGDTLLDDYKFSTVYEKLSNTPEGRKAIARAEKEAIDFDAMFSPSDMYNLDKSIRDMAYDPNISATQQKAYIQLSGYLNDRMGKLADMQGDSGFIEQLNKAKELVKDKGKIFGFDASGKNAEMPNIPKLIAEGNPDEVIKLLMSDPFTFDAVNKLLPASVKSDLQDFIKGSLLQKNTIQGKIGASSIIDFKGLSNDIDKMDTRTLTQLLGEEEALNMKFLSTVGKTLGTQLDTLVKGGNVLGAGTEKRNLLNALTSGPVGIAKFVAEILGKRGTLSALMAKDRASLRSAMVKLEQELNDAGIKDRKGLINQVINDIDELPAVAKTPRPKEDFGPITGVDIIDPADVVASGPRANKARFKEVSQKFSSVNRVITAQNRVSKMSAENRDIYNDIKLDYEIAKRNADVSAMDDALKELETRFGMGREAPRDTPFTAPTSPVKPKMDIDGPQTGSFVGGGIQKAENFEATTAMPVAKPIVTMTKDGEININRPWYNNQTGEELTASSQIVNSKGAKRDTARVANFDTFQGDGRQAGDTVLNLEATKQAMSTNDSAIAVLGVHYDTLVDKFGKPYADLAKTIIKDNPDLAIHVKNTQTNRIAAGVGGSSDSPQGVVKLPKGAQGTEEGAGTFLHEIVHQATVQRYNEDQVFREGMDNLFAYAKKESSTPAYGSGGEYWKYSTKEMMAEAFANPKAQAELMAMPTPSWFRDKYPKLSNTVKNAWDAFVFLVTGASTTKVPDDNVLTAMGDLLASNVNTAPSGAGSADALVKSAMNVSPFTSGGLPK